MSIEYTLHIVHAMNFEFQFPVGFSASSYWATGERARVHQRVERNNFWGVNKNNKWKKEYHKKQKENNQTAGKNKQQFYIEVERSELQVRG